LKYTKTENAESFNAEGFNLIEEIIYQHCKMIFFTSNVRINALPD